jgi:hypothetical protein
MLMVRLSTMWTFQIPSPHPVNQLEPNVGQSKNNDTCDSRRNCRVHIHYEDEVVNVNQFRRPPLRHERDVDTHVDRF